MIEDAKIRQFILRNLPDMEPWRVEMEELNHGDAVGVSVLMPTTGKRERFSIRSWGKAGRDAPKQEATIAFELTQMIRAALLSTPDNPLTVSPKGKIVSANGSPGAARA